MSIYDEGGTFGVRPPEFDVDPEPGTFQCAGCDELTGTSHFYEGPTGAQLHEADPDKRAQLLAAADAQRVTLFDPEPGEARPSAMTRETTGARSLLGVPDPPVGILVPPEVASRGEDVPGVLRWVTFVGGTLDGVVRPIGLFGREAIVDGSSYDLCVPHDQTWRYSAERDRFELVAADVGGEYAGTGGEQ